jgi:peptidoglycan/LPS O-acetylase OafA/YrhL
LDQSGFNRSQRGIEVQMSRKLDAVTAVAILGAAALLVSLFADWYRPGLSAWEAFEVDDLLLASLAMGVLATVLPLRAPRLSPAWHPWLGAVALLIVLQALLDHPPVARGRDAVAGPWIALGAAALIFAAGVVRASDISLTISFGRRVADRRPPRSEQPTTVLPDSDD